MTNKIVAQGVSPDPNPPEVEAKLKDLEELKRLVGVFSRGVTYDRLAVALPDDVHGEWVHENEIPAMRVLGFEVDKKYAVGQATETRADGAAKIQDVVFMVCPKRHKELIDRAKNIVMQRKHGDPRQAEREITLEELNKDLGHGSSLKATTRERTVNEVELQGILKTMQSEGGAVDLTPSTPDGMVTQLLTHQGTLTEETESKT